MAKALTKEDYEAQGAKAFHARSTLTERFGVSKATTWQQRAFLSGWQKAHDSRTISATPVFKLIARPWRQAASNGTSG